MERVFDQHRSECLPATCARSSSDRSGSRELHILRFEDGKAVEHWGMHDNLAFLEGLA